MVTLRFAVTGGDYPVLARALSFRFTKIFGPTYFCTGFLNGRWSTRWRISILGSLRPLIEGGLGDLQFVIELASMNRYGCLSVEHVDTVGRAYKRFVLRRGPLWLILFVAALVPAFASSVEIGTMTVARSCNPAGVQLCTGTVTVLNEMDNFLMVNISFTVDSSSYSSVPAQIILPNEAVTVQDQGGADEYKNVHGLTLLSVFQGNSAASRSSLTFITPAGTFTASSDSWASPQFQANFAGPSESSSRRLR